MKLNQVTCRVLLGVCCSCIALLVVLPACAEPLDSPSTTATKPQGDGEETAVEEPVEVSEGELEITQGIPLAGEETKGDGIAQLSDEDSVWIDVNNGRVIVDGSVCLRQGVLEMFACPAGTKEHEAIVAVDAQAQIVHAGLLAVGAEAGNPVQFRPDYMPATGTEVAVYVLWTDENGNRRSALAQEWIRSTADGSQMDSNWVFAGSTFIVNEQTRLREYGADTGDLICVSNFPTATLDLPIESTELDDNLLFEAFTEHIPAVDTPIRLILVPNFDAPPVDDEE